MSKETTTKPNHQVILPSVPSLCVNAKEAALLSREGELETFSHSRAGALTHKQYVLTCHAPYTKSKLGESADFFAFDVLELFAFVHPATFCVPTPTGLCKALGITPPDTIEDAAIALTDITRTLLENIQNDPWRAKADPLEIAQAMGMQGKGWPWASYIFAAFGKKYDPYPPVNGKKAMSIWKNLPEWAEEPPPPPPAHHGVTEQEAQERLTTLLGEGAEQREQQYDYTATITQMLAPAKPHTPKEPANPHIVLAEAGTGTGKTMGYLAPASVWTEKNEGAIWISTYTKNLQRQIDQELDRLYPDPALKEKHVAIRKGRENYLCLLNLEDKINMAGLSRDQSKMTAAGIMARWAVATKDGDLSGATFPGWLASILGFQDTIGLADRRGECIFSACDHYHKCFVEHSIRKAKHARFVVANHALALIQAAMNGPAANVGEDLPSRYIFDEGHHLFEAADSAFSAHLTARETRDLRRWILGAEGGRRTRARGLSRRIEDLISGSDEAEKALQDILINARALTNEGWAKRLNESAPEGPCEQFLLQIYRQTFARAKDKNTPYSLETETQPVDGGVLDSAVKLKTALKKLAKPMSTLATTIHKRIQKDDGTMEADTRKRLDAVAMSLERRGKLTLDAWINMLETLEEGRQEDTFIDWMEIERIEGRTIDIGLYRHYIDPMKPFAATMLPHLHGMAVTSATLQDSTDEPELNWQSALERTGARHMTQNPITASYPSPYNYKEQTKVYIINDVRKDDLGQVAGAYRALFQASGGGALGLFTAINRLKSVHAKIAASLEENNLHLYAQHIDEMDSGTLVDIFRDDEHACLLGTDAMRDGVDVPGSSLRLIVFDRVPWPRPTILHRARRKEFGERRYDEMITRLKIKQAFGRLIRRENDKGIFVMLDSMLPTRLQSAFPDGCAIIKCSLSQAVQEIDTFLKHPIHKI